MARPEGIRTRYGRIRFNMNPDGEGYQIEVHRKYGYNRAEDNQFVAAENEIDTVPPYASQQLTMIRPSDVGLTDPTLQELLHAAYQKYRAGEIPRHRPDPGDTPPGFRDPVLPGGRP